MGATHSSALPDVTRLAALPSQTWAQLADRFRLAGFDAECLEGVWKGAVRPYEGSLQRPILLWRVRRRHDAAAYAYRMFILRDPVTDEQANELLGRSLLDKLIEAGMLVRSEPGGIASVLDLRMFRGLLILCDVLLHHGDAVFGVGPGTSAFCGLSARRGVVPRALDVGCGAGAVALWLSRYAEQVVATDINRRALVFLKINAVLNRITNVEARESDLFEAVTGETFDIITSQPPHVPAAPGASAATYLYGGPLGNEIATRIVADVSRYLHRNGRATIVFEQARRDGVHGSDATPGAMIDGDMRTLFIVGSEVDADAYSIRHAIPELRRGVEAFDKAATLMREHLNNVGIRGVCQALCVLEHANGSPGWSETVHAGDTLWSEVSTETIERLLGGHALLHQSVDCLQRASARIPEGTLVIRPRMPDRSTDQLIYLGLPPGYLLSSLELSQKEWDLFEALHRREPVDPPPTELLAKVARAGLVE